MRRASLGRARRAAPGILAAALCGMAVATASSATGVLDRAEQAGIGLRFELRPGRGPPDDVVIVAATDKRTLEQVGSNGSIPRSMHARLLDHLHRAKPKVIAYDFRFRYDEGRGDDALIAALGRAKPIVLATEDVTADGETPLFGQLGAVEAAGVAVGVAKYPYGPGGVYDRVQEIYRDGLLTLPAAVAELAGSQPRNSDFAGDGALIDYAGPAGTVRTVEFVDVLHDAVPSEALRGKIVVVGTADPDVDRHPTPVASRGPMSGAEINANAISTILRGFPLRDATAPLDALVLLALCLAGAAAGRLRRAPLVLVAGGAALLALAGVAQLAFGAGTVLDTVAPALGLGVSLLAAVLAEQRTSRRERARLGALVARLAPGENPEHVLERVAGTGAGAVLHEGSRLGVYRIGAPLGLGAMGVVYRARHEMLDRWVAIKVLAPALAADERTRERMRREALSSARLEHPNVVAVFDAGEIGGRAYIAMQLVEGRALHDLVGTPQLTTRRIAEIVCDVAAGLDHAHERGVVHRDVKPQNILVEDAGGRALLADFGIAAAAEQERMTSVGDLVGTVAYAAPEQLSGAEPDRLVDVYALGCVLYELLTGHLPFECATVAAAVQAHLSLTARPVSDHRADLRVTGIDAVVARALAKDPGDRWQSAGALASAARQALASAAAVSAPAATVRPVSDPGDPTRPT
ncbi:MAG: hypothetical protein QOJ46_572 [bacterium]